MPLGLLTKIRSALARGTQRLLASRILTGLRGAALQSFAQRRAPELPPPDVTSLVNHAREIRQAGEQFRFLEPDQQLQMEQQPVNPYLFEDDPFGNRIRIDVNVLHEPSGQQIRVAIKSPTNMSLREAASDAMFQATVIFSYEKFGIPVVNFDDLMLLDVVSVERQF